MKSLSDLKRLFRQTFPVKAGGPTDKARSAGAIASLDAVAETIEPLKPAAIALPSADPTLAAFAVTTETKALGLEGLRLVLLPISLPPTTTPTTGGGTTTPPATGSDSTDANGYSASAGWQSYGEAYPDSY